MPLAFVRYRHAGRVGCGRLDGHIVRELKGNIFNNPVPTGVTLPLANITLLAPAEPSKIIAVGRNYKSHLGERPAPAAPASSPNSPIASSAPGTRSSFHREPRMCTTKGRW